MDPLSMALLRLWIRRVQDPGTIPERDRVYGGTPGATITAATIGPGGPAPFYESADAAAVVVPPGPGPFYGTAEATAAVVVTPGGGPFYTPGDPAGVVPPADGPGPGLGPEAGKGNGSVIVNPDAPRAPGVPIDQVNQPGSSGGAGTGATAAGNAGGFTSFNTIQESHSMLTFVDPFTTDTLVWDAGFTQDAAWHQDAVNGVMVNDSLDPAFLIGANEVSNPALTWGDVSVTTKGSTLSPAAFSYGIFARLNPSTANGGLFVIAPAATGKIALYLSSAGGHTLSSLGSFTSGGIAKTDKIELRVIGQDARVYLNGTLVLTVLATGCNATGAVGLWTQDAGSTFDVFAAVADPTP